MGSVTLDDSTVHVLAVHAINTVGGMEKINTNNRTVP